MSKDDQRASSSKKQRIAVYSNDNKHVEGQVKLIPSNAGYAVEHLSMLMTGVVVPDAVGSNLEASNDEAANAAAAHNVLTNREAAQREAASAGAMKLKSKGYCYEAAQLQVVNAPVRPPIARTAAEEQGSAGGPIVLVAPSLYTCTIPLAVSELPAKSSNQGTGSAALAAQLNLMTESINLGLGRGSHQLILTVLRRSVEPHATLLAFFELVTTLDNDVDLPIGAWDRDDIDT
ncbi:MAG: hypothetical protein M1836_006907 [Candelina mexicana]|nr:MAG: hypothetical protein M1836_006907 [Candelina mexicana]